MRPRGPGNEDASTSARTSGLSRGLVLGRRLKYVNSSISNDVKYLGRQAEVNW